MYVYQAGYTSTWDELFVDATSVQWCFCDLEPSRHAPMQGLKQRISATVRQSLQPPKAGVDTSCKNSSDEFVSYPMIISRGFTGESEKIIHSVGHGNQPMETRSFLVGGWFLPL